ncbi:MAG: AI-2E family transporter, partial [bacterium]|nr:AI-2E family transporter [bacterium]
IKDSVNAVVRGSILIALMQGGVSVAGFFIFGIPNPVLLGAVAALSTLIPSIGTALVFVPVVIYALLSKSLLMSLGIAFWGILVVGPIDNFVRPYLVEKGAGLHPAVVFLSVIGGILVFGPLGFIIGPVIFSVFFALLDLYATLSREETN